MFHRNAGRTWHCRVAAIAHCLRSVSAGLATSYKWASTSESIDIHLREQYEYLLLQRKGCLAGHQAVKQRGLVEYIKNAAQLAFATQLEEMNAQPTHESAQCCTAGKIHTDPPCKTCCQQHHSHDLRTNCSGIERYSAKTDRHERP